VRAAAPRAKIAAAEADLRATRDRLFDGVINMLLEIAITVCSPDVCKGCG